MLNALFQCVQAQAEADPEYYLRTSRELTDDDEAALLFPDDLGDSVAFDHRNYDPSTRILEIYTTEAELPRVRIIELFRAQGIEVEEWFPN